MASVALPRLDNVPSSAGTRSTNAWTRDASEMGPRRSLKRSKGSLESLKHRRSGSRPTNGASTQRNRGGLPMRVGNVTSSGRLELRPVARSPCPPSSFPVTPPLSPRKLPGSEQYSPSWRHKVDLTGTNTPQTDAKPTARRSEDQNSPKRRPFAEFGRARSHSLSTVSDSLARIQEPLEPRGADGIATHAAPGDDPALGLFGVSIPDHRLADLSSAGSSMRDARSSHPTLKSAIGSLGRNGARTGRSPTQAKPRMSRSAGPGSPQRRTMPSLPSASMPDRFYPDATVTQELEIPDDGVENGERPLVRLSRISGQVMAATTTGLIAQITSPNLLDYDLLSDFFLTYRSYMTPSSLLSALLLRLAWAVGRSDDFGRIVRVRVFVGLRHWILNYFGDDFVPDLALRRQFCDLVNELSHHLQARADGGGGDLKIVGELKKCWRRTCALYWDIPEHEALKAIVDVFPGGASLSSKTRGAPHRARSIRSQSSTPYPSSEKGGYSVRAEEVSSPCPVMAHGPQPSSRRTNRDSNQSTQAFSCSFPMPGARKPRSRSIHDSTSASRPQLRRVPSSSLPPSVARSRSRSRTYRSIDRDKEEVEASEPATDPIPQMPFPGVNRVRSGSGSLIRGEVVKPRDPRVDHLAPPSPTQETRSLSSDSWSDVGSGSSEEKSSSGSNPGMKRLIGGVRRVLSTKHDSYEAPTHGRRSPYTSGNVFSKHVTPNNILTSHNRYLMLGQLNTSPRVDLLSAMSLDDYEAMFLPAKVQKDTATIMSGSSAERSAQAPWDQSILVVDQTDKETHLPISWSSAAMLRSEQQVQPDSEGHWEQPRALGLGLTQNDSNSISSSQQPLTPPLSETGSSTPSIHNGYDKAGGMDFGDSRMISLDVRSDQQASSGHSENRAPAAINGMPTGPQLKRQPGGNLRTAEHVRSLQDRQDRRRPQTLSTTGSQEPDFETQIAQLPNVHIIPQPHAGEHMEPNRKISLIDTRSIKLNMRTSFEQEIARIARLPDNGEDGGIDAALRKLEGDGFEEPAPHWSDEYQPSQPTFAGPEEETLKAAHREDEVHVNADIKPSGDLMQLMQSNRPTSFDDPLDELMHLQQAAQPFDFYDLSKVDDESPQVEQNHRPTTFLDNDSKVDLRQPSYVPSELTGTSTPLLQRGASHPALQRRRSSSDWLKVSLPPKERSIVTQANGPDHERGSFVAQKPSNHTFYEEYPRIAGTSSTNRSFLLDDDQNLSGAGLGIAPRRIKDASFYDDNFSVMSDNPAPVITHPFRHSSTPPRRPEDYKFHPLPPSVHDLKPAHELKPERSRHIQALQGRRQSQPEQQEPGQPSVTPLPSSEHLPFILSVSSKAFVDQCTLIEADALSEVDWRELIELRWAQSANPQRTWMKYLTSHTNTDKSSATPLGSSFMGGSSPGGIDLCINRFNIMVKWAISEIVLCHSPIERAACITKYIHIASQARRVHNWATMYQITTALVSADVSRLKLTWDQVPLKERSSLKQLETLITPLRNFANLRAEMERALASDVEGGCIPFIGLYTHDLIYNAQKPEYAQPLASSDGKDEEQLINFERHRMAASIVKDLLRMLDASARYRIEPEPDVLSHCLWMACLDDGEISKRSRMLEP